MNADSIMTMDLQRQKELLKIGIIGLGDMGRLYAKHFHTKGWKNVYGCDLPDRYEELKIQFHGSGINILRDGFALVRLCDFVMFSVEAAAIDKVVSMYGPSMKVGAIASGQTSVKDPEIKAFVKYLPEDVNIVTCHSLHGPNVNPRGQPLVIIRHRSSDMAFQTALNILESLESNIAHLTAEMHDQITADTQAVTHVAFLSMGTAWKTQMTFPWENPSYVGGIENVKTNMALRIYSNKWHVYAGLALMNPYALPQIQQYARSVSSLFKLMIQEKEVEFTQRLKIAKDFVFGKFEHAPILLSDSLLDQFSLSAIPKESRKPNSHLSLLAMVDSWYMLGIQPYQHLICQTPPFRLLLGITEYLFRNEELLSEAIRAALYDKEIRGDDCEFYTAAQGWVECIALGNFDAYRRRFEETAMFFSNRAPNAKQLSAQMIEMIASKTTTMKSNTI